MGGGVVAVDSAAGHERVDVGRTAMVLELVWVMGRTSVADLEEGGLPELGRACDPDFALHAVHQAHDKAMEKVLGLPVESAEEQAVGVQDDF